MRVAIASALVLIGAVAPAKAETMVRMRITPMPDLGDRMTSLMLKALLPAVLLSSLLGGCAANQLSPAEISRLQGGTTTVVVFGFCVPMDHIIKTTLVRTTLDFVVDGKSVGTMQSCSHKTFQVKSGYWDASFVPSLSFPYWIGNQIYRPGATQYLYMAPAGHGTYSARWVSKAEADEAIADISKIGQVF